jgi:hypothetical protein
LGSKLNIAHAKAVGSTNATQKPIINGIKPVNCVVSMNVSAVPLKIGNAFRSKARIARGDDETEQ